MASIFQHWLCVENSVPLTHLPSLKCPWRCCRAFNFDSCLFRTVEDLKGQSWSSESCRALLSLPFGPEKHGSIKTPAVPLRTAKSWDQPRLSINRGTDKGNTINVIHMYPYISFIHEEEWYCIAFRKVDSTRDYQIKHIKSYVDMQIGFSHLQIPGFVCNIYVYIHTYVYTYVYIDTHVTWK